MSIQEGTIFKKEHSPIQYEGSITLTSNPKKGKLKANVINITVHNFLKSSIKYWHTESRNVKKLRLSQECRVGLILESHFKKFTLTD